MPDNLPFHRRREDCRLCHSTLLETAVPLRPIPIKTPNVGYAFEQEGTIALEEKCIPLNLSRCTECGHLQLLDMVDPHVQYRAFRYRTSISLGLSEHFRAMARDVSERLFLDASARVLEIGSNDGTLLSAFQARGMTVLGIDPARSIAADATHRGIPTLAQFFNMESAEHIRGEYGSFDLVLANNTLANLDDLDDIGAALGIVLSPDGVLVVETQDGAAVIEHGLVDTIYHEHLGYFLVRPLERWLRRQGLELFRVERQPTKGGSLRLYARRLDSAPGSAPRPPVEASVRAAIEAEEQRGLFEPETYRAFNAQLSGVTADLARLVHEHRSRGGTIAGYGASVGSVTLLRQFELDDVLDFIVDDDPLATSMVGAHGEIPVLSPAALIERSPSLVILLAPRYANVILEKSGAYLDAGGSFAVPLPELRVVERQS